MNTTKHDRISRQFQWDQSRGLKAIFLEIVNLALVCFFAGGGGSVLE